MASIKELQEAIMDAKYLIKQEEKTIKLASLKEEEARRELEKIQNRIWKYEEEKEHAIQAKRIKEHDLEDLMGEHEEVIKFYR